MCFKVMRGSEVRMKDKLNELKKHSLLSLRTDNKPSQCMGTMNEREENISEEAAHPSNISSTTT